MEGLKHGGQGQFLVERCTPMFSCTKKSCPSENLQPHHPPPWEAFSDPPSTGLPLAWVQTSIAGWGQMRAILWVVLLTAPLFWKLLKGIAFILYSQCPHYDSVYLLNACSSGSALQG